MLNVKIKNDIRKVVDRLIPKYKTKEGEDDIKDLIESLLELQDTKVITSPVSGIYYMFNPTLEYTVRMTKYTVTISNHDFSFQEDITEQFGVMVKKILDNKLESDIRHVEEEVYRNRRDLLRKMKDRVRTKFQVQQKKFYYDGE